MAEGADLDPQPGGVVSWTHPNGDTVSGRFVEVDPPRRLVFTYGWERAEVEIPPGSTTVEIDLIEQDDGTTTSPCYTEGSRTTPPTLTAAAGRTIWTAYVAPSRANGWGPIHGADRRVPTPEELAR